MKNKKLFFALLIGCASLQACDHLPKPKNSQSTTSTQQGDDADAIVQFYNKAVQLDDQQAKYAESFRKYVDDIANYIQTKQDPDKSRFALSPTFMGQSYLSSDLKNIQAPKVLGSDFQKSVSDMETSFAPLLTYKDEIKKYLNAEDYKDDKGAKIQQIKTDMIQHIDASQKASDAFFTKIKPEIDKASAETLKDHPLKEQIIQSKDILHLVKESADMTAKGEDVGELKKDFSAIYGKIQTGLEQNKSIKFPSDSDLKGRKSNFDRFNNKVEDYLGRMRIVQRNLNEGKPVTDQDQATLDGYVRGVLDAYNSFVD